jgi:tetratricopeptide (TPR) repeat protein
MLLLARRMRADEVIVGTVISPPNGRGTVEVRAELRVTRDWRLRQPLPLVRAANPAAAGDTLAREIARARTQLTPHRRCENAARGVNFAAAVRHGEEGVLAYPRSVLARTCLLMALRFVNASADSVVRVAEDILAVDTVNIVAAVIRAAGLTSLERPAPAALAWARVLELRPDSLDLALTGVETMMRLQKPQLALEWTRKLIAIHAGELRLRRLLFRANIALSQWKDAAALGDSLDVADQEFRDDSTYATRHIEALRLIGDTLAALSKSARVVRQHPGDLVLYLQYVKLINGEAATALPRGLALFPEASELRVLQARAAVSGGRRREAIDALGAAVSSDPTLVNGFLQMAELWFEEGQPDSALAAIGRVPRGTSNDLLRAYAISRGRQTIRTANDSTPSEWRRAISLFSLADTLDSQDDTRSLIAASTLQLARSELLAAIRTKTCPESQRSDQALLVTAAVLERGVGEGSSATELREVYAAMRESVDNALKVLCK